jgi:hypothetical protein
MHPGRTVFAQLMAHISRYDFQQCVARYRGEYKTSRLSCWDQYLCMAFAQLTYRESLRDIETCLRALQPKLYHMGIRTRVARSTLADANEGRDWRIYAEFTQTLIRTARELYAHDAFALDLTNTVYALDATIIDLCLSVFPWARYRRRDGGIKLHAQVDLRGVIPSVIQITEATCADVTFLDDLVIEPGAFYIMDRGYSDFERLFRFATAGAFFVTRWKRNLCFRRRLSHAVDRVAGVVSDQTGVWAHAYGRDRYPAAFRRIHYVDPDTQLRLVFLTNNLDLPALTIAQLYKCRWQVELFFKWIKQHLRIKAFYGTSENAVKTQIWIALSVYVLVAIVRKRLAIDASLYRILQVLSLTLFEKMPISIAVSEHESQCDEPDDRNQLQLFDL